MNTIFSPKVSALALMLLTSAGHSLGAKDCDGADPHFIGAYVINAETADQSKRRHVRLSRRYISEFLLEIKSEAPPKEKLLV